ncbi:unnamed protein product, partial [marine sediment metagenome]
MPDPKPKRRYYHLTPHRLLIGVLAAQGFLLLADRFALFGLNRGSGWNVLLAVALVGLTVLIGLLWFAASLLLRRRFDFSIWSLGVLTLAVAIVSTWFAVKMQQARRQGETVKAIVQAGCGVRYDYEFDESGRYIDVRDRKPPAPAWLRDLLPVDFFSDVVLVGCLSDRVGDDDLIHLESLNELEYLQLRRTQLSDDGLEHLRELANL